MFAWYYLILLLFYWIWTCSESVVFFCFSFYHHFYEKNLKIYNMCQYYLISINISYVYSKLVHDYFLILYWSRRGRDRMLVGSTTTYAIGAYPHWFCGFDCRSWLGEQHYVIKFVSDLWQVGGFLGVLHHYSSPPRYSWNIVESGVKHQKTKLIIYYLNLNNISLYDLNTSKRF